MISKAPMSSATKTRASTSSSCPATTSRMRRPAPASILSLSSSAMPSSSPRVSSASRPSPALSFRSRMLHGRTSLLVPLNAFDRDTFRRVPPPASPPPMTEPAPPPPPPPPPRDSKPLPGGGGAWIAALFAALALWWGSLFLDVPEVFTGADDGFSYVKTEAGNKVLIAADEAGRTFLVDANGNLYYDSGIEEVGWYIVSGSDGEVTNLFYDEQNDGKLSRRVVGNIRDLKQVDAEALAGFKLDDLDKEEYLRGTDAGTEIGTIVGFANGEDEESALGGDSDDNEFELPPNAPLTRGEDGSLRGPPVLEEGVLTLRQRKEGAKFKPREGDRLDQLVQLFDSAVESGAVGAAVGNPVAEGYGMPQQMPPEVLEKGAGRK